MLLPQQQNTHLKAIYHFHVATRQYGAAILCALRTTKQHQQRYIHIARTSLPRRQIAHLTKFYQRWAASGNGSGASSLISAGDHSTPATYTVMSRTDPFNRSLRGRSLISRPFTSVKQRVTMEAAPSLPFLGRSCHSGSHHIHVIYGSCRTLLRRELTHLTTT